MTNGLKIVVTLLLISVGLGSLVYYNLKVSNLDITQQKTHLLQIGNTLTVEECLDELIAWAPHCKAMKSLCVASVPVLMQSCLSGKSRAGYCKTLKKEDIRTTRFGYSVCQRKKKNRYTKKVCTIAYRALAKHCDPYL